MISARNVNLHLSGKHILSDVSLTLAPGEVLALCGPNGAGKSSLLACLAGEHAAVKNSVHYFDAPLSTLSPKALANKRVVLEQSPSLSAEFTLLELVELGAPLELTPQTLALLETRVFADFGLQGMETKFVSNLSGGQQHRAHLARVTLQLTVNRSQGHDCFLFLDEPTASLDIGYQIRVLRLARALAQDGVGVLVVLHDLNLAAAYADRVVLMRDGRIVTTDTPAAALTSESLSDLYETPIFVEKARNGQFIIQPAL